MKKILLKSFILIILSTATTILFCMDIQPTRQRPITNQELIELIPLEYEAILMMNTAEQKLSELDQVKTQNILWKAMHNTYKKLLNNARNAKFFIEYARDCYQGQDSKDQNIFVPGDKELCITGFLGHKEKALHYLQIARQIATDLLIPPMTKRTSNN